MHKLTLAAAIAVIVALGAAGVASAINGTQTISAKITQSKAGTKAKPRSVGTLTVTTGVTPAPGEVGTFATKTAVLFFDKNIVFGMSKFKSCTAANAAKDNCPSGAKVGSGSANAQATIGGPEALKVVAWNGPGANTLLLHATGTTPLQIDGMLTGKLSNATGDYGKKLTITIPTNLQMPSPGITATLTQFIAKIGGTSNGTPYVGLKGCSGGKLKVKGTFTFTDGTSQTKNTTIKCSK
jgi:hypothetical protein